MIERPYRVAILWGGLRGAVTLALALAVTESLRVPAETRRIVGILATGFTLFTLIVQGTTLRWVIGRLGLDRLSPLDAALSNQVIAVALQIVREDVAQVTRTTASPARSSGPRPRSSADRLDEAVGAAEENAEILDRDRITLGLIALAGAERDLILERIRERADLAPPRRPDAHGRRPADRGRRAAAAASAIAAPRGRALGYGPRFRDDGVPPQPPRLAAPLARLTADRFELLLSQRLILRDLDGFIDARIRRIHGRRVADLLHELLERRSEAVEQALDGLRLQYPGYAEELERRFIRRTALRLEEREYASHARRRADRGRAPHRSLRRTSPPRRAEEEGRPRARPGGTKGRARAAVPAVLRPGRADAAAARAALVTRYVDPGEVIVREGRAGRAASSSSPPAPWSSRHAGAELAARPRRDVRPAGDPYAQRAPR